MKKILFLMLGLMVGQAMAADFATDAVLLQALDKTTGRTSFLTVNVGEPYEYGDLLVTVERCMKRPPEETPENSVFLNVSEKEGAEIFHGWMFSSNPAISAMEHPVYDIWVVECKETPKPAPVEELAVVEEVKGSFIGGVTASEF